MLRHSCVQSGFQIIFLLADFGKQGAARLALKELFSVFLCYCVYKAKHDLKVDSNDCNCLKILVWCSVAHFLNPRAKIQGLTPHKFKYY